jgi:hypothetical protein
MQTVRSLRRAFGALSVFLLAVAGPLVAAISTAPPAAAQSVLSSSLRSVGSSPITVSITGMTPSTATPTAIIQLTGTLANHSGSAMTGIDVQAWSSSTSFTDESELREFPDGNEDSSFNLNPVGPQESLPDSVANGQTVTWKVSFPASDIFADKLGVFPIAVQATAASGVNAIARTFLPYWPGSSAASVDKPLAVSWVWPLIDTPQQGACPATLATSELAGSVASGGRLNTLLAAGAANSQPGDLTWAIDPALLSDVNVMTRRYATNLSGDCSGRESQPADAAATAWLNQLKTTTAGASAFLTPYANVDAAALSHTGLDDILQNAYKLGGTVADQILPGTFGAAATAQGGQVLNAAMPANGQADTGVLGSLGRYGNVNTVILSSTLQSSAAQGNALGKTISDSGTGTMALLFADSGITSTLGGASASASPSSQFSLTQTFLAETAMIAAEYPSTARSLVIEPPTNWDPSPAEAKALLADTSGSQAPWLNPTPLSTMSTDAKQLPELTPLSPDKVYPDELSDGYMDRLAGVATEVQQFQELLYKPTTEESNQLIGALAVTASSAWRGTGPPGISSPINQLASYVGDAENDVKLIASPKILLTGPSGQISVSVQNNFSEPIWVTVTGTSPLGSDLQLTPGQKGMQVPAHKSNTMKVSVSSGTLGTTRVQLQLATANGTPLPGAGAAQPLSVEVTRFGRLLLIIIVAALGILVLTSVYRVRRKRASDAAHASTPDEMAKTGGAG